jgi:hypothetical protein
MNVFKMKEGRYVLLLDILGFSELVTSVPADAVYNRIDTMLQTFAGWERFNRDFGVLYFSDTVVFYQIAAGWGSWAFSDVYAIGSMVWSALAAGGIPTRGAISFGPFTVKADSRGRHNVFFGDALVEAYRAEQARANANWIGISICPSAWQAVEYGDPGSFAMLVKEGRFRRAGSVYRVNPLIRLGSPCSGAYYDHLIGEITGPWENWLAPEFPNEVKAIDFLESCSGDASLPSKVRAKYQHTVRVLRKLIDPAVYAWAMELAAQSVRPTPRAR